MKKENTGIVTPICGKVVCAALHTQTHTQLFQFCTDEKPRAVTEQLHLMHKFKRSERRRKEGKLLLLPHRGSSAAAAKSIDTFLWTRSNKVALNYVCLFSTTTAAVGIDRCFMYFYN